MKKPPVEGQKHEVDAPEGVELQCELMQVEGLLKGERGVGTLEMPGRVRGAACRLDSASGEAWEGRPADVDTGSVSVSVSQRLLCTGAVGGARGQLRCTVVWCGLSLRLVSPPLHSTLVDSLAVVSGYSCRRTPL